MRGRIMRIEKGKFYIITETGDFVSSNAVKGFKCGDEVEVKNERVPSSYIKPLASIAAAIFIMCGSVYAYHIPVRYVDVCINPEIQLSLNVINRVVDVKGHNDDGMKIVSASDLKNDTVNDAIDNIVNSARELGYMDNGSEGERDVIVSVFGNGADALSKKIPLEDVRVVNEEVFKKAQQEDIPVGKYVLMNELAEADSSQSTENIKNMSVKQIIDELNSIKQMQEPTDISVLAPEATVEQTPAPSETATPETTIQEPEHTEEPAAPTATPKPTKAPSTRQPTRSSSSNKSSARPTSTAKPARATASPAPTQKPDSQPQSSRKNETEDTNQNLLSLPSFDKVTRPSANKPDNTSVSNGSSNNSSNKNNSQNTARPSAQNAEKDNSEKASSETVREPQQQSRPQGSDPERNSSIPEQSARQPDSDATSNNTNASDNRPASDRSEHVSNNADRAPSSNKSDSAQNGPRTQTSQSGGNNRSSGSEDSQKSQSAPSGGERNRAPQGDRH